MSKRIGVDKLWELLGGGGADSSSYYESTVETTTTTEPEPPRHSGKTEFKAIDGTVVLESGGSTVMRMSLVNAYRALNQLTDAIAEAERQIDAARSKSGGN